MAWLETGPDERAIDAVFEALELLSADPEMGHRDLSQRARVFRFTLPAVGLVLTYLVADQFHTVRIVSIDPAV